VRNTVPAVMQKFEGGKKSIYRERSAVLSLSCIRQEKKSIFRAQKKPIYQRKKGLFFARQKRSIFRARSAVLSSAGQRKAPKY